MSGETEKAVSGWTVDTLHSHLTTMLAEQDRRAQQRFEAQEIALQAALTAQEKAVLAALAAADRAVAKAEQASERRFESVNEFRGQLADQTSSFVRKEEVDTRLVALTDKTEIIRMDVQRLREEAAASVGRRKGLDATTAAIYAGMVLLVMVAGIVVSYLANHR